MFLLTNFLLKFEEHAYCVCTPLWFFLEDDFEIWKKDAGYLKKAVRSFVTVAKVEKSFLLKSEFNISTNFCIWANLERNKLEVIIIQLPIFMSLVTYEISFEKEY